MNRQERRAAARRRFDPAVALAPDSVAAALVRGMSHLREDRQRLAIALGRDLNLRRRLAASIRERRDRLYRDAAPIRALEGYLTTAAKGTPARSGA